MELNNILPSILVVFGWFIVNYFTAKRERESKNREIRYLYLSNAHSSLSSLAHRKEHTVQQKLDFEKAIEDIQIFGDNNQIKILKKVLSSDEKDFNKVILSLRNEMRKHLGLEENRTVLFWRIQ